MILRSVSISVVAVLLVLGVVPAANAAPTQIARAAEAATTPRSEVTCTDDACDGFAWQSARGLSNEISYWGMFPGHNCTNYVAWKLIATGVARPRLGLGNASEWADKAVLGGYAVDATPRVGAVAHWNAFAPGYGAEGHVAYVEQINDDGTILISEDFWSPDESDRGPLTFRTVNPATVSNFIHFIDVRETLRQADLVHDQWSESSTGLMMSPARLSAVRALDSTTRVAFVKDDVLHEATSGVDGWTVASTRLASRATSVSAVDMGGSASYVMTVDEAALIMNVSTPSGWQRMPTGVDVSGEIAALNTGGPWPNVFVSQGGALYEIWGNPEGWHVVATGLDVWGPIAAVNTASGGVEIFSVESGYIHRSWADSAGWHQEPTGILATSILAAVGVEGAARLVILQDDAVVEAFTEGGGWYTRATGIPVGTAITAVGGSSLTILQSG